MLKKTMLRNTFFFCDCATMAFTEALPAQGVICPCSIIDYFPGEEEEKKIGISVPDEINPVHNAVGNSKYGSLYFQQSWKYEPNQIRYKGNI